MSVDIKPHRLNLYCRTCLKEVEKEKYKLNELPYALHQLLLLCVGDDCKQLFYPDSLCVQCYDSINNFLELQNKSKKSNIILKDLLKTDDKIFLDENEETNESSCPNEQFEDPLNCVECEMKIEPQTVKVFVKELAPPQHVTNIEKDFIKTDHNDVLLTTDANADQLICKYGCDKTFRHVSNLKTHYRLKHRNTINLSDGSSSNDDFDDFNRQQTVREKKFECKICHKKYIDRSTLTVHQRLHLDKLPFKCERCERTFNKKVRLTKHMHEKHSETPLVLECKYGCGKTFNRYHALDDHHYKHRNNKLESIGDALKSKNNKASKEKRIEVTFQSQDAFVCEDCGKVLPNVTKFREHSFIHRPPEERPYKCEECNKTFIIKRSYKEHLIRHAGIKNFECNVCGLKKTTRRELVKHLKIHTKEAQVSCTLCSKVYADPKTLKQHIENVHQRLKKYNCRYCAEAFAKCDVRNRHESEHGAERPHKCKLCNESFFLISKLSSHIRSVHTHKVANVQNDATVPTLV